MARSAGFGGGGDYSSAFSSIYSASRSQQRAEQDAEDANQADLWQNGMLDDDSWLAYIRTRITAESSDPKRQQRWVEALRKYSVVIADNKAETAYKNGGSIHDLIAHYQGRYAAQNPESNEARDIQIKLNDLIDSRASKDISAQSQKIIDSINAGKAKYSDLLAYYQSAKTMTRPNSDLMGQIDKQIGSIKETIRTSKLEGQFAKLDYLYNANKLSGSSYATQLRKMAVQFKDSDPQRYYQILEAATKLSQAGGSGGGGGGGGGRSGPSAATVNKKKLNATIDGLQGTRNNIQALIKQFEEGLPRGIDPATGKVVTFTPELVQSLDRQLLKTWDSLSHAYTVKGDKSAAANMRKAKSAYIATNIVEHNTLPAEESFRELLVETNKRVQAAQQDPDPSNAMRNLRDVAKDWQKYSTSLTTRTVTAAGDVNEQGNRNVDIQVDRGQLDQIDPDFIGRAASISETLNTLTTPGVDDATAAAAVQNIQTKLGGDIGKQLSDAIIAPVLGVAAYEQGLSTGDVARVVTEDGVQFVRTKNVSKNVLVNGQETTVQSREPDMNVPPGQLVDVFIDINGVPTKVKAVANVGESAYQYWRAAGNIPGYELVKGQAIQDAQRDTMAGDWEYLVATGAIEKTSYQQYVEVEIPEYTDSYGTHAAQKWVQDPATKLWYRNKLPIRGAQLNEDDTLKIGVDGQPTIDWAPYAHQGGVPAPYAGNNERAMQTMFDGGAVDARDVKTRNLLGNVDNGVADLRTTYYDPNDGQRGSTQGEGDVAPDWWREDRQRGRVEKKVDETLQAARAQTSRGGGDVTSRGGYSGSFVDTVVDDTLGQIGKMFGVDLNPTKAQPSIPLPKKVTAKDEDRAAVPLPDAPKSYSGPSIANLETVGVRPTTKTTISTPKAKPVAKITQPKPKPQPTPTQVRPGGGDITSGTGGQASSGKRQPGLGY